MARVTAEPAVECAGHCYSLTESGAGYIDPKCPKHGVGDHDCSEHEVVTEPTAKEYLAATRQYRDVPALSAFMAGVVAEMLTPEQRARVIAYMREEEARVGVRS